MTPTARTTARVVPVSPDGAVLLLQDQDPAAPGVLRWGTIGGAVEPGESVEQAAVRELHEETGIVVAPEALGPAFHRGQNDSSWAGVAYTNDSTFFTLALGRDVEVVFDHLEAGEVGHVVAAGWWWPDDLAEDGSAVAADLPDILRAAVAAAAAAARGEQ